MKKKSYKIEELNNENIDFIQDDLENDDYFIE